MNKHLIKYIFVYVTPLLVFVSIYLGGIYSYIAIIYVFGLIPFLEFFFSGTTQNMNEVAESLALQDKWYDLLLYSLVPVQVALLIYFLYSVDDDSLLLWEKIGLMTAFGMTCGALGINAAHELGHRNTRYEQMMSKILLATTQYMHFFIEHNRGHHKNVSTDEDPASARYGETVYGFFVRSIRDSWLSAWHLEEKRLAAANQNFWSLHNEMLRFQIIQISILLTIFLIFDWQVLLFYMGGATIGFLLLETVNYIEHYGLRRKKVSDGRYERTLPIHSWNSNHSLGRILLLEVTRHSDHHYLANRKYQVLRHFDESPQMPTGYPGMMLLSLIPPLWFKVMHRQIEKYRATSEGAALA
ncbi:MAG TPA: alkane 1-monooxygenase [Saprospiraceae bacterium]|nr:alkane 1-monooxygenase [Saprospiraceae bacterium]